MAVGKGPPRVYDPKESFLAWAETGTLPRAVEHLYRKGYRSRKGGKPSLQGIQKSAISYMIWNKEICRDKLLECGNARFNSDREWYYYLISNATFYFSSSRGLYNWLMEMELLDWAIKFRKVPSNFEEIVHKQGVF